MCVFTFTDPAGLSKVLQQHRGLGIVKMREFNGSVQAISATNEKFHLGRDRWTKGNRNYQEDKAKQK